MAIAENVVSISENPSSSDPNIVAKITTDDVYRSKIKRGRNCCFYCKTYVLSFARHLIRNHRQEKEVRKLLRYPPDHKERRALFSLLRKKGNFWNSHGIQKAVKKPQPNIEVLPCSNCLGFFSRKLLRRHIRKCDANLPTRNSQVEAQNFLLRDSKADEELKTKIFPKMRPDNISLVAKRDELICAYASQYMKEHKSSPSNVISRKMRELARLAIEIQKMNPELTCLFKVLHPNYFDLILEATKIIAMYDKHKREFKSPTYAMNMGTSLKQCCDLATSLISKNDEIFGCAVTPDTKSELKALYNLLCDEWSTQISNSTNPTQSTSCVKKEINIVSLACDVHILKNYLDEESKLAESNLMNNHDTEEDYSTLLRTVFCKIALLNGLKPHDLQTLLLKTYTDYSEDKNPLKNNELATLTEKILLQRFKPMVIRGRDAYRIAIMLSPDIKQQITALLKHRQKYVKAENYYLFCELDSVKPIVGRKATRECVLFCNLIHPYCVSSMRLKTPIGTLSRMFYMSDSERDKLIDSICHEFDIQRQSYTHRDDIRKIAKLAKLLLLLENGSSAILSAVRGKSIEEIDVDLDGDLLTATNLEPRKIALKRESTAAITLRIEDVDANKNAIKRTRWTREQKDVVSSAFAQHIVLKKPPKRKECDLLISQHTELLSSIGWLKMKVFIQNKYTGKLKN